MSIFEKEETKKNEVVKQEETVSLPTLSDIEQMGKPEETPKESTGLKELFGSEEKEETVEEMEERPAPRLDLGTVPVFIKLDKYEDILDKISEIRKDIEAIRSSIDALREMEKMKEDNIGSLQIAVEEVEKKFLALDAEFVKPTMHEES